MSITVVLLFYVSLTSAASLSKFHQPEGKIVGGTIADVKDVPWQVALEDGGFFFCGGSIISANYILTAAQCTHQSTVYNIIVRAGTSRLLSEGTLHEVESFVEHPNFYAQTLDNDISIIKLANPIELSEVTTPVVLRTKEAIAGEEGEVSGFGTTGRIPSARSINLNKATLTVKSRSGCNVAFNGTITENMICTSSDGRDTCDGDTGGALTADRQQIGIVSWGKGCALPAYPRVFSNVSAYKAFIDANSNNEAVWK